MYWALEHVRYQNQRQQVRLFFGRGFVKTHVDQSKAMRQRGIHCVQTQDAEARISNKKQIKERI